MQKSQAPFIALFGFALLAAGCATESAATDESSPAQQEADVTFKDSRGYRFASKRLDHVLDEIEATDVQRAKADELKDRFAEDIFDMRDDGKDIRAEVLHEWKRDDPDAKAMHALVDERIEAYRKVLHDAVDGAVEMHGVLTKEQRAELAELVEKRMDRHHR